MVLATSCDWFVFDNQEGYNAQIEGRFLDSKTGDLIQFASYNTNRITVVEEGWDAEAVQEWYVKPNGTYRNKLVFAGKYRLDSKDQCFYDTAIPFTLEKGANTVDFTVTPFARVLNPSITYDAANHKLIAKFTVEVEDPKQTSKVNVNFFGFTDRWVSESNDNFKKNQKSSYAEKIKISDGKAEVELTVDTEVASGNQFLYKRDHYLRIGVLAYGDANSNKRYNYSPVYKANSDFSKIEEVTVWDEAEYNNK